MTNERGRILRMSLGKNIFPVRPYRFVADEESIGNLLVGVTLHDKSEHFNLANTQSLLINLNLTVQLLANREQGIVDIADLHIDFHLDSAAILAPKRKQFLEFQ